MFSEGKCYVAKSPVLGGTGTLNNPFQAAMIDYQKRVGGVIIYSVFAVAGQPIAKFSPSGVYFEPLSKAYFELNNQYPIKYFLWQQGETDASIRLNGFSYTNSFYAIVNTIGINSPLIARSTYCNDCILL